MCEKGKKGNASHLFFGQHICLCYVECLQGPLKTFSLITKLAKHYLQSKYYLNSECLLVLDTRCTPILREMKWSSRLNFTPDIIPSALSFSLLILKLPF